MTEPFESLGDGDDASQGSQRSGLNLLTLPAEIRVNILTNIFQNTRLVVTANNTNELVFKDAAAAAAVATKCLSVKESRSTTPRGVLMTCRQMYNEGRILLYRNVNYICEDPDPEKPCGRSFSRLTYEHGVFTSRHVEHLFGFPVSGIVGDWDVALLNHFPKVKTLGLDHDVVIPASKLTYADVGNSQIMEGEMIRLLRAKLRSIVPLDGLQRVRAHRPQTRIWVRVNFLFGLAETSTKLHVMTVADLSNMKIVQELSRHKGCKLSPTGGWWHWRGCEIGMDWIKILDLLDQDKVS